MVTRLHSVFSDLALDPPLEVCGACEHGVAGLAGACGTSVTDVTVQLPATVHLAYVWATRVTMATGDSRFSSISSANHVVCDVDTNAPIVLRVAHSVGNSGHLSLLQVRVHASWVLDLSPTCDVALVSWLHIGFWKTHGLYILAEQNWFLQLEQSNVVVEVASVVLLMHEHLFHLHVDLRILINVSVMFSHSHLE